jgi:exonuclease VII large subunit
MSDQESCAVELKVDVGILKNQVVTLTQLCNKMDSVIEKLVENQQKMAENIYDDMDKRKSETTGDIKELHSRITTVDRNLSDKIELTERRIMEEIKSLRTHIEEHNKKEDGDLKKILQWKWMVVGGAVALAWVLSNVNLTVLGKLFGN